MFANEAPCSDGPFAFPFPCTQRIPDTIPSPWNAMGGGKGCFFPLHMGSFSRPPRTPCKLIRAAQWFRGLIHPEFTSHKLLERGCSGDSAALSPAAEDASVWVILFCARFYRLGAGTNPSTCTSLCSKGGCDCKSHGRHPLGPNGRHSLPPPAYFLGLFLQPAVHWMCLKASIVPGSRF